MKASSKSPMLSAARTLAMSKFTGNASRPRVSTCKLAFGFNDLREALATKVESFTSIGNEVTSFQLKDSKVHVSLSNEKILDTDLLVIAEGRNSTLAKSVASEKFSRDYQQIANTFLVEKVRYSFFSRNR